MNEVHGQDRVPAANMGDDEQENEISLAEKFVVRDPNPQLETFMFDGALQGDGSISEYIKAEAGSHHIDESMDFPRPAEEAQMQLVEDEHLDDMLEDRPPDY